MTEPENIYTENGFSNRTHYLLWLADQYGKSLYEIQMIADMMGPQEDFDGLVTALEAEYNRENCFPFNITVF